VSVLLWSTSYGDGSVGGATPLWCCGGAPPPHGEARRFNPETLGGEFNNLVDIL